MFDHIKNNALIYFALIAFLFTTGCDKSDIIPEDPSDDEIDYFKSSLDTSLVSSEDEYEAIFLENVSFSIDSVQYEALDEIIFKIYPKEGSVLVDTFIVNYSKEYIESKNFLDTESMSMTVPVFGLFDANSNVVSIISKFSNGKQWEKTILIETKQHVFSEVDNMENLASLTEFDGESYLRLETDNGPMILDIEGNIRWVAEEFLDETTTPSIFFENHLYCKEMISPYNRLMKLGFDGSQESITVDYGDYPGAAIHHEINYGSEGFLLELNVKNGSSLEKKASVLVEVNAEGDLLQTWDMDDIIGKCLSESGVAVDTFIRNALNNNKAIDWFHMNSAAYDVTDNTVLISSRENFVIKVGYDDQQIKWILGDTTKFWYSIDTLKHYALHLTEGNINIGQHALSLLENGELMMFNNGENSSVSFFPKDQLGATHEESMISVYKITDEEMQAKEVLNFRLPHFCPNRGCVQKNGEYFIVDYLPVGPDYNSLIALYDQYGNSLIEIKNRSYFCVRAYAFSNKLRF